LSLEQLAKRGIGGAFDVLGGGTGTPEPGTLVLLGSGLLGLGGMVRRRLGARS